MANLFFLFLYMFRFLKFKYIYIYICIRFYKQIYNIIKGLHDIDPKRHSTPDVTHPRIQDEHSS